MTLRKTDGTCIAVDPFNYLNISGVAFCGIYLQHFLPLQMIAVVAIILSSKFYGWSGK